MGNLAAKIIKRAGRPFKNFAVEARTERLLERKKPSAAPWHPTTQKRIEELMAGNFQTDNIPKAKLNLVVVIFPSRKSRLFAGSKQEGCPFR